MGYGANLFGATSTFGATSFDIGSDLINSLDFLGYNASHIIINNLLNQFYSSKEDHNLTCTDTFNGTTIAESAEKVEIHQIWGILGILIMFLPGIASILPFLFSTIKRGRNLHTIVIVIAMFMFPFTLLWVVALLLICSVFNLKIDIGRKLDFEILEFNQDLGTMCIGNEALFESFPQILLQLFTIAYGNDSTIVQKITILGSFFLLARIGIVFDLVMENKVLTFKDTMIHTITRLPVCVTTIAFRVLSFTLTLIFLRKWAVIPICILFLEILIITHMRYQNVKDSELRFWAIWFTSFSNLAVLNVYSIADKLMDKGEKPSGKCCRNFIILQTVISFVHHTLVLVSIMALAMYHPEYLQQAQFDRLILKPDGVNFFYAFGTTYAFGILSSILCLNLSQKVSMSEKKDQNYTAT